MHDSIVSKGTKNILQPPTVLEAFTNNLDAAPIHLHAGMHGAAETISRAEIYGRGCALARKFQSLGVEPGDKVMTILPTGKSFLVSLFGAWLSGTAIVPISPPAAGTTADYYQQKLASMIRTAQPKIIIAEDSAFAALTNLSELTAAVCILPVEKILFDFLGEPRVSYFPHPDDPAHIQFTSGSTSFPKGAEVLHKNLVSNIRAIDAAISSKKDGEEHFVSWLPIHHDMGFLGGLCFPFYQGIGLNLIPTETFIRNPAIWLKTISDARATLSPAPTFAYDLLGSRISDARLKGIDLSSWRYAWVGAEPIFLPTLEKFTERFAAYGLPANALKPCYGLAEATLAVTLTPLADSYKSVWIDQKSLRETNFAEPVAEGAANAVPITCCGTVIENTEVKITNEAGAEIEDRRQGRVLVRGASVMKGYMGDEQTPIDADGWLDTGDLGFKIGGEMYITGRAKDLIIRGGVNIHPQEIEKVADQIEDVRMGTATAFSCVRHDTGKEEIILVVETRRKEEANRQKIIEAIRRTVIEQARVQLDHIELAAPGTIPKTTSGKIQRGLCRERFLDQLNEK